MSAYSNQMSINVAEVATLTFIHQMNGGTDKETSTIVAMVTTPIECLKEIQRVITDTLKQYEEQAKPTSNARNGMN